MRVLGLLFASTLALLCAGVGCGDDHSPSVGGAGDAGLGGGHGTSDPGGGGTGGNGGERDAEAPPPDAASDASSPSACELIDQAFAAFLAANRSCAADDCRSIGDCSPNADWRAVTASAAAQGYALMQARCNVFVHDGPEYGAQCEDGLCVLGEEVRECGLPFDAGVNEPDASDPGDAAVDGG